MIKSVVPIVAGAVLGFLAASVFLRHDTAGRQPGVATDAAIPASSFETVDSTSSAGASLAGLGTRQLSAITDALARRDAALSLLDIYGYSADSINEVSAQLPLIEGVNFKIDAIVELGERDSQRALTAAVSLPEPEQRRLALTRLARVLAELDPLGAVAHLDDIDTPALESEFMVALLDTWALVDPGGVINYLEGADKQRVPVADFAFEALADRDPERLLAIADELAPDAGSAVLTAALESLIERDPVAALSRIEALKPGVGSNKGQLQQSAASAYGERDAEAAWLWAHEDRSTIGLRLAVLAGIQKVDPDVALDLVMVELTSADPKRRTEMRESVGSYLFDLEDSARADDVVSALDRMLRLEDSVIEANVQPFIGNWSVQDPDAALEWSLRNLDRIDPNQVLTSLGGSVARTNTERARQALFELPDGYRLPWVTGVGRTLAENDLAGARAWAFELPRGPLRDAALREYVRSEAHGGSVDVQIFEQFSDDVSRGDAASQVAFGLSCDGHTTLALEIASTYIANPSLLEQTERQIEGNARSGATVGNSVTNLFCVIGR